MQHLIFRSESLTVITKIKERPAAQQEILSSNDGPWGEDRCASVPLSRAGTIARAAAKSCLLYTTKTTSPFVGLSSIEQNFDRERGRGWQVPTVAEAEWGFRGGYCT